MIHQSQECSTVWAVISAFCSFRLGVVMLLAMLLYLLAASLEYLETLYRLDCLHVFVTSLTNHPTIASYKNLLSKYQQVDTVSQ